MNYPDVDIAVIGGGPGGYVAAIRAAQLGARVALIESEALGGVCLNWGCIPTKALLHAAEAWRDLLSIESLGLKVQGASFDFAEVMKRSRAVAGKLSQGVRGLLMKNGVKFIAGRGRLLGEGRVQITDAGGSVSTLYARDVVLATGARPRDLSGIHADGKRVWTSRDALSSTQLPRTLLIVGAGAIGMEFASFYQSFGAQVTVLEVLDDVLPQEDAEVSAAVASSYRAQGVQIRTGARLKAITTDADGIVATVQESTGDSTLQADAVLIAVGVVGNVEDLGLETTQVRVDGARIEADAFGKTADPRVHAIGDVTGAPWLAHRAMHQGVACVEQIMGLTGGHPLRAQDVPGCTYGHPQTASIGLTERAAREQGMNIKVGRFPLVGNGKAVALGDTDGFIKTVVDADTGEILGAHLVGPGVTELIGAFGVARVLEGTDEALLETVWPHPTLSESLHESVLAASSRALHI
ncbi:dihydrolipoyl dehydrogenase [Acidovorax sp. JHL-9]|uniref:dihydrolipoyl dehydrogenase n=1 Tax=Acidovorax sp. JHL-9 TaxID=1276756 RepID=UPI00040E1AAF|nr:dihydrolipoyl dehydrogenase [Acidovorax sp. JHL-9]